MSRRQTVLAVALTGLVGGYVVGAVGAAIPAPRDPGAFWPGNLAAPYVVLPVLVAWLGLHLGRSSAGSSTRRRVPVLLGAVTGGAMIAGFYRLDQVRSNTVAEMGLAPDTSDLQVVVTAYRRWFSTFVLGVPGGIPWLSIGVVAGAAGGLAVAVLAARRGGPVALVALPLVAEAGFHVCATVVGGRYVLSVDNLVIWSLEAGAGVLLAIAVVVRQARVPRTLEAAEPA